MQAPRTLDLPCPWVHYRVLPQRLAYDSLIERSTRCICGAKPPNHSNRSATLPVSEGTPEGVRTESPSRKGQAPGTAEPDARSEMKAVYRTSAEASVRDDAQSQVTTQTRPSRQRASPDPGRSAGWVLPRRHRSDVEATLSETHGKPREPSGVPSGRG